jgi:hypothetical protein
MPRRVSAVATKHVTRTSNLVIIWACAVELHPFHGSLWMSVGAWFNIACGSIQHPCIDRLIIDYTCVVDAMLVGVLRQLL